MMPKHIKKVPESRKAIAPYNFVELPDVVVPSEDDIPARDRYYSDRHTGTLECVLTTDSPLYIRCGMTPENFAKFSEKDDDLSDEQKAQQRKIMADFFQHPTSQRPVLPGSSLRGMLRTLVEIVGYGKLTKVHDNRLIYRAVGDTSSLGEKYRDRLMKKEKNGSFSFLMQAGYMIKQKYGWAIQPAKLLTQGASFARIECSDIPKKSKTWKHLKNAYEVAVQVEPIRVHKHRQGRVKLNYAKVNSVGGNKNGVLVKTGRAPRKHMEFVFGLPDEASSSIPIPNEMIEQYQEQITDGQTGIVGKKGVLQNDQPVFYRWEDGKLIFFGHTMMFRLPYEKSVLDFIPQHLRNPDTRDLAEAIFGFVQGEKKEEEQAQSGRVFIGDAICQQSINDDIWWTGDVEKRMTPQILASPKPTTFQHYLVQETDDPKKLKHYGSETVIRGHKLYWHQGRSPSIELPKKPDISESQTTDIKPIKSGVSFEFTIHFENLSSIELGAVLWVLNLAGKPNYRLSLGMGKPLGMGAVRISSKLQISDRKARYKNLFDGDDWSTGNKPQSAQAATSKSSYIKNFEEYVLEFLKSKCSDMSEFSNLEEIPRIQMLLKMLQWPNSEIKPDQIDYMQLGDYKKRPILPTPLQLARSRPKPPKKTNESSPISKAIQRSPKKPKR